MSSQGIFSPASTMLFQLFVLGHHKDQAVSLSQFKGPIPFSVSSSRQDDGSRARSEEKGYPQPSMGFSRQGQSPPHRAFWPGSARRLDETNSGTQQYLRQRRVYQFPQGQHQDLLHLPQWQE